MTIVFPKFDASINNRQERGADLENAQTRYLRPLSEKLKHLRHATCSQRVTLRIDSPLLGVSVDDVLLEDVNSDTRSLRSDSSMSQRELETVIFLDREKRMLVQENCAKDPIRPPDVLLQMYGVKAQMLCPLIHHDAVVGWISVHDTKGPHSWNSSEIQLLKNTTDQVYRALVEANYL